MVGPKKIISRLNRWLLRSRAWALPMDRLWLVVVLAAALFLVSLVPLVPNDFWWHLKVGEVIFENRQVPQTNMFAWTIDADRPFVYGAWLGELLFYLLYAVGQVQLVTFARNVLWGITLLLVAAEAHRRTHSWRLAALAIGVTALMTLNNLIVRPQNWSWVPFAGFVGLLSRYVDRQLDRRWLLACPLLMIFWVNVHGAFVLGIVLFALFIAGALASKILQLDGAPSCEQIRWMIIVGGLTSFATLINPQGLGIVQYVINLMTDRPSQNLVIEWQSPAPSGFPNTVFYVTILVLIFLLWFSRRRHRLLDVLILGAFLWLAWTGVRYVVWFALIVTPMLVDIVGHSFSRAKIWTARRNVLNMFILLLVVAPVIGVQPWLFPLIDWPLPDTYYEMILLRTDPAPFIAVETPVDAVEYLRANPMPNMFHEMGYGSYFIWAIPEQGVFVDPRIELYEYEQWLDYLKITNGIQCAALLDKYDVKRIVLDTDMQENLQRYLEDGAPWRKVYESQRTQIWDYVGE